MATPLILDSIIDMVAQAVEKSRRDGFLQLDTVPTIEVERPSNPDHGDFATSLPLRLAKATRINPLNLAEALVQNIPAADEVAEVTAAPPGFINFKLRDSWVQQQVEVVRRLGAEYGNVAFGKGRRMMVEFVSVNPTGPVHIGHARGAVLGSSLANILAAAEKEWADVITETPKTSLGDAAAAAADAAALKSVEFEDEPAAVAEEAKTAGDPTESPVEDESSS